jgi:hypothetical protein
MPVQPIKQRGGQAMTQTGISNLAEALEEISRCTESLRLILEVERERFLNFDTEGLIHTTAEKNAILQQLKQAEGPLLEQKAKLAKLANLDGEEIGLEELVDLAVGDRGGKLKQLVRALIRRAQAVSAQLQRNRAMLEEGLAFVNDALACFQAAMTGENTTYAPLADSRQRKPGAVCLRREV